MRIELLGTGGYHPNERRHTACVMLPEVGIVFDAGTSFFRVSGRLETRDIQIFLSHAHLDHIAGLTFFLLPMTQGDVDRVCVYGTPATLRAVQDLLFAEPIFPVQPDFEYVELSDEVTVPNGGVLTHLALEHPCGSTGYRIDWSDRCIAYITDTTAGPSYVDFIDGVDVLIHECNFPDEMAEWAVQTGHSHSTQVAELARDAQVGQLILLHFDPQHPEDDPIGLETVRQIFPNTLLAEDLMTVEF